MCDLLRIVDSAGPEAEVVVRSGASPASTRVALPAVSPR
jgi:hypothetical protein